MHDLDTYDAQVRAIEAYNAPILRLDWKYCMISKM